MILILSLSIDSFVISIRLKKRKIEFSWNHRSKYNDITKISRHFSRTSIVWSEKNLPDRRKTTFNMPNKFNENISRSKNDVAVSSSFAFFYLIFRRISIFPGNRDIILRIIHILSVTRVVPSSIRYFFTSNRNTASKTLRKLWKRLCIWMLNMQYRLTNNFS